MKHRRRALLSVTDKTGLADFARGLAALEYELISTGGTAAALRDVGLSVTEVGKVTGFPELMDGRLKTLHPKIHGGLLARTGIDDQALAQHEIDWIDILAVNLYPFERVAQDPGSSEQDAIENIDVGGPAMLRAGAKNHSRVTVIVDPADYGRVLTAVSHGDVPQTMRREFAVKAFAHTARYDAAIASYLGARAGDQDTLPASLVLGLTKDQALRYGENPHQEAALYRCAYSPMTGSPLLQLQGKALSFNNILDSDAAWRCVTEFTEPACVIVKHTNPCGVALRPTIMEAYEQAFRTDPSSAFGGVIAVNRPLDELTLAAILERQFVEIIIAPEFGPGAMERLAKKPAVRVLRYDPDTAYQPALELRTTQGGILVQQRDTHALDTRALKVATLKEPTARQMKDLLFAWTVAKHVKSNAIVYAKGGATIGVGAGQTSRVMSARVAALKAKEEGLSLRGAVMASDAFFPFRDGIDAAAKHRIRAVIQPGGSVRDDEVIAAANDHGMAMVLTGIRHFRH